MSEFTRLYPTVFCCPSISSYVFKSCVNRGWAIIVMFLIDQVYNWSYLGRRSAKAQMYQNIFCGPVFDQLEKLNKFERVTFMPNDIHLYIQIGSVY